MELVEKCILFFMGGFIRKWTIAVSGLRAGKQQYTFSPDFVKAAGYVLRNVLSIILDGPKC